MNRNMLIVTGLLAAGCGGATTEVPGEETQTAVSSEAEVVTDIVRLRIDGMMCQGCADAATEALQKVDGVVEAEVSFEDQIATVRCERGKVGAGTLVATLQSVEMGGRKMPFEVSVME